MTSFFWMPGLTQSCPGASSGWWSDQLWIASLSSPLALMAKPLKKKMHETSWVSSSLAQNSQRPFALLASPLTSWMTCCWYSVLSFFLRCVRLSVTLPLSVSWSLSLVFLDLVPFSFFSLLASFLEDRRES